MTSGVALVTTVWLGSRERTSRAVDVLNTFLLYHISIGVDRVAVFFDGDATQQPTRTSLHADVQSLVAQGRIELFYRYASLDQQTIQGACSENKGIVLPYADCVNYDKLRDAIATDVASRQMLHAEMAMHLYTNQNKTSDDNSKIRWLLHLDVDELFYCEGMADRSPQKPASTVLHDLVQAIEIEQPFINQLTVINYEAVPTSTYGGNYLLSTTKFRRHIARIALSGASHAAMQEWQLKSPHRQFFLFYDNGKSLVRLPIGEAPAVPASVHHWRPNRPGQHWRSVSNFYDPRRSDVAVWHEPQSRLRCSVLHFPVCGLEWLTEKYTRLGDFPETWGGTLGMAPMKILPCFHLQARDACRQGEKALERLYRTQVMMDTKDNDAFWQRQFHAGVCEEITFARELLMANGYSLDFHQPTEKKTAVETLHAEAPEEVKPSTLTHDHNGLTVQKAWMLAAISEQYL